MSAKWWNTTGPNQLIAADTESHMMVQSSDGGITWQPDKALTQLVTGNGVFAFQLNFGVGAVPMPVVRQIAFDPDNRCHVLIGTRGNGVFRSADGATTWDKVPQSDGIGDVSSFYFSSGKNHPIYVSSYGRGLWTLDVDRSNPSCQNIRESRRQPEQAMLHDWRDGKTAPFGGAGKLSCARCALLAVKDGRITDVEFEGSVVRRVFISGGSVHEFDAEGRPREPTVANGARRARSTPVTGGTADNIAEHNRHDCLPAYRSSAANINSLNKYSHCRSSSMSIVVGQAAGGRVRSALLAAGLPDALIQGVSHAYHRLEGEYGSNCDAAERSRATADDLPSASFAGRQESTFGAE